MYYYLNGILEINEAGTAVIDCSGVAYKLTTSLITSDLLSDKVGQKVKLYTHLAVREDGIELFGFENNDERECFNKLITVSGVGPKAAMSILSIMTPDNLALSVCTEDIKAISKASGIGSKTAARIVLELKDKMSADLSNYSGKSPASAKRPTATLITGNLADATEALVAWGYDKNSVSNAMAGLDPKAETAELIRLALKKLGK